MEFTKETGKINLVVTGKNGFIKRKTGTLINVPSSEIRTKLMNEYVKTKDNSKLIKFNKDYPKIMDGDTLISGKGTIIQFDINYEKDKLRVSKSVFAAPNSEFKISGLETWDIKDTKNKERTIGQSLKNIELIKGFFNVDFLNSEESIITPTAEITFNKKGYVFVDVYSDKIYSLPTKGTEYKNKLTKKTFCAKSETFEEIIVTKDSIYRKGLTNLDEIFQNPVALLMVKQKTIVNIVPDIDSAVLANDTKNASANFEQALASLEMFKNMSPDDITRLMKTAESKMTPEQRKQMTAEQKKQMNPEVMKQIPEMVKMMEQKGILAELKKANTKLKGMTDGLGDEGIDRMTKYTAKGIKKMKDVNATDLEAPRKYNPLTKDFGCVKVG